MTDVQGNYTDIDEIRCYLTINIANKEIECEKENAGEPYIRRSVNELSLLAE